MRHLSVILLGLLSLTLTSCPGDLDEALRQYGYTPVRPASTFWQPGAIVYIIRAEPLEVGYICTAKQVMGENYRPMQSPTLNADLARATRKAFTFSANYLEMIRGDTDMHDVKSIKMSLRNARLFEINDSDIDGRVGKIDPACMRHVRRRLHAGEKVTMINSALQADVVYTVQYDRSSKLDSSAQLAVLQNLALKLGVEASALGGRTIEAKDLIWGVRDDETLVSIFNPQFMRQFDWRNSRLLDADRTPALVDGHEFWHREPRILGQDAGPYSPAASEDSNASDVQPAYPDAYPPGDDRAVDNNPEGFGDVLDDGQNDGETMGDLGRVHPRDDDDAAASLGAPTPLTDAGPSADVVEAQIAANANLLRQAAAADGVALAQNYWLAEPVRRAGAVPAAANGDVPPPLPAKDAPEPLAVPSGVAGVGEAASPADGQVSTAALEGPQPLDTAAPSPSVPTPDAATPDVAAPASDPNAAAGGRRARPRRPRPSSAANSSQGAPSGVTPPSEATTPSEVASPDQSFAPATPPATPADAPDAGGVTRVRPKAPPTPRKGGRRPRPTSERRNSIG